MESIYFLKDEEKLQKIKENILIEIINVFFYKKKRSELTGTPNI